MPKLPSKLKQKLAASSIPKTQHLCKACLGSGKNSQGGRCYPCLGKGIPQEWACIKCGAKHHLIYIMKCRNSKCKMFGKEQ